jgi:tryptophanyl-tRNA synthetase
VKRKLSAAINGFLDPIRERRSYYQERPKLLEEIIQAGSEKARKVGAETVRQARSAMKLDYFQKG